METLVPLILSSALLACSALFSGLTLGYFTLDAATLARRAKFGDVRAARIMPLRQRGNHLLTTLLLGNVAVNAALSIFLNSLASGVVAGTVATALIFVFGEITPQAVISRYAVYFGSFFAPVVRVLMILSSPITWPIAWILDRLLGDEIPTLYSHSEIMEIIAEHERSSESLIDADEKRIVHGALQFSHRTVREVMTPLARVVAFDENQRLTHEFFEQLREEGYSRYPVFSGHRENIVGLLFAKDLLTEDDGVAIKDTEEAYETHLLTVTPNTYLDVVLASMLKRRQHLAIVKNRSGRCLGLITLEDIIEEIIQVEIEDEGDDEESGDAKPTR